MSLFDGPDDEARLPGWLDAQIASPNLRQLASELATVNDTAAEFVIPQRDEMIAWLGDDLDGVLARGTEALKSNRFEELFSQPHILFGLQSLVFAEGGRYWTNLAHDAHKKRFLADRDRFEAIAAAAAAEVEGPSVTGDPPSTGAEPSSPRPVVKVPTPPVARPSALPRVLGVLAACVALALGIRIWSANRPTPPWGWNSAGALADATNPEAYLEQLATAADQWSASRPVTEAQLATRLRELRSGCDRLIAAPHSQLTDTDREKLVEKCTHWREKIDAHLEALAQTHDVTMVRTAADVTVANLIKALRGQAADIRARRATPA